MVQIFRALAIIAVVFIHTTPVGVCQVFCRPFINFCVATFLFLSGYLTPITSNNWGSFYNKRIIRVIIPYIIWTAIYTLPSIAHYGVEWITQLGKSIIKANAGFHFYYIPLYIQFVLLTPALCRLANSRYRHLGWLIAPISVMAFSYYDLLFDQDGISNSFLSLHSCLNWFTFYYLGLLLGNGLIKTNLSLKTLVAIYALSILAQMAEGYGWLTLGEINCGSQLKLTSLLTSSIFLLFAHAVLTSNINIDSKILRKLGNFSFGIYLCHVLVIIYLRQIPGYNQIPYPLNTLIVLGVSFSICYIGHHICGPKLSKWMGFN